MDCRIVDLRYREVVNICNGHRLGCVSDVLIEIGTGRVTALIVPGPLRFFGLFGREEDYIIPWECIDRIGEDIILISIEGQYRRGRKEKRRF